MKERKSDSLFINKTHPKKERKKFKNPKILKIKIKTKFLLTYSQSRIAQKNRAMSTKRLSNNHPFPYHHDRDRSVK